MQARICERCDGELQTFDRFCEDEDDYLYLRDLQRANLIAILDYRDVGNGRCFVSYRKFAQIF